ncbi:Serine/threonine-protein kinase ULK4, partial [Nibea albiflora]
MENFILYEELGTGSSSVVYKGRKKGTLSYVAIVCADKAKRPYITNHVRLSHDLEHPNIACFYEWYETSNHLWLVVELCTGGSLESVIAHDGYLSEDVVRRFGWDLVKGLKHIHELGVIFSDLTPAKILLDGSGILKFGNFCMSKAEGETLEDFFTLFSTSVEADDEDIKENFSSMRKMLQGKPPFYSDIYTELTEMILYQEPRPPRQTVISSSPPSEDFQNLLKGLLNKNPDQRIPDHFSQVQANEFPSSHSTIMQSTSKISRKLISSQTKSATSHRQSDRTADRQQAVRHTTSGALRNSKAFEAPVPTQEEATASQTLQTRPLCLRLLLPYSLKFASTSTDITSCVKDLLYTDSDLIVTPIMDNPKAVSTLTDLLRENLRNNKIKQLLLPPLGEFLYLIASQDDSIVHHMAAKAMENISTTVSGPSHHLVTTEIGSALWYLFTHSTVEAVRVTAISVSAAVCEELIRTSLSIVEVLSQHHALTTPHHRAVMEWSVFVLRVLSEFSLVLLVQESDQTEDDEGTEEKKERRDERGRAVEGIDDGSSCSEILAVITKFLLPRMIKHSRLLPTVFQLIMANSGNVTSGMIQNAVALLCNLSGDTVLDLEPPCQQELIEVVVSTLSEAALVHLEGEEHAGRKVSHLVLQALLELLHNILKQTSVVVRSALQLSTENQEVWEESMQCLSLLVQLYGGEGYDCLSPSCLQSFLHVLRTHMHTETPRIQRTALRIIKRL